MIPFEKKVFNSESEVYFYNSKPFYVTSKFQNECIYELKLPSEFNIIRKSDYLFYNLCFDSLFEDVLKVAFFNPELYIVEYNHEKYYAIIYDSIIDWTCLDVYLSPVNSNGIEYFLNKVKMSFSETMNLLFNN